MNAPVRAVVWDWNGTLLDDVEASLTTMNTVLQEYDRPALDDADNYRATFGFPVREFYRRVGFEDEEVFLDASRRYLELLQEHGTWPSALAGWRREVLEPRLAPLLPRAN